jgi:hypothetical protein
VQVLVLESEGGVVVSSKSEATIFCLTRDKFGQNYTFTWLREFEGSNNSPEVLVNLTYLYCCKITKTKGAYQIIMS